MAGLLAALFGLSGCTEQPEPSSEIPISGGTTDHTDPDAPKQIESKVITEFHASFSLMGEWIPGTDFTSCTFDVESDDAGVLRASETETGMNHEADEELLQSLQEVIDTCRLAEMNGVYRVTAGLPPEYQECYVRVKYASGESLRFTINNDPEAEWEKRLYLAFAEWFAEKGDPSLLPPKEDGQVLRLVFGYRENAVRTDYTDITVGEEDAVSGERYLLRRYVYNEETQESQPAELTVYPADYFGAVSEILAGYDLRPFDSDSVLYGLGRTQEEEPDDPDVQIWIEYEDGRILNIRTSDPGDLEMLKEMIAELAEYHASLFAE